MNNPPVLVLVIGGGNQVLASSTMPFETLRETLVGKALRYNPEIPAALLRFSDDLDAVNL